MFGNFNNPLICNLMFCICTGLPASSKLSLLELALSYNEVLLSYLQEGSGEGYMTDVKETICVLEKTLMGCLQRCKEIRHGCLKRLFINILAKMSYFTY